MGAKQIVNAQTFKVPLPEHKPVKTEDVFGPKPVNVEKAGEENSFSILEFTASLLDFEGSPIPGRKPEFIPQKPTPVKRLLKAAKSNSTGILERGEADLYKAVFTAQAEGDIKKADEILEDIKDSRLIGHVLFQRYMHPKAYTSTFLELKNWLELFNDHPGAQRIHKLAQVKKPEGLSVKIKTPVKSRGVARKAEPTMRVGKRYASSRKRSDQQIRDLNALNRAIYGLVRKGQPTKAYEKLQSQTEMFDSVEYDLLQGEISAGYLYQGHPDKALVLAQKSIERSGLHVPKAGWVAGLVAWRNKKYSYAARYFEIVARSSYASGWTAAAGSYWAARAHMRVGNVKAVSSWLKRAMAQPRTFYGLISTRALGHDFDFNWKVPPFTKDYLQVLTNMPAANRAMALVLSGQPHLAEAELIRILPKNDKEYKALLSYAGYSNLPGLAMRLATSASSSEGAFYDAALYPTGPWKPQDGYKIDPALVHAIMRQESRFDPQAKSPSGAKGLMQLMPATAKSVADKGQTQLDNPETNLELGQRYLENLLDSQVVEGDLLYLLIAYNAGPGNLAKWKKRWQGVQDPLLFIELIPSSETRAYVERVLSNYWIYRMREGANTPTLDAIASGKRAIYGSKAL